MRALDTSCREANVIMRVGCPRVVDVQYVRTLTPTKGYWRLVADGHGLIHDNVIMLEFRRTILDYAMIRPNFQTHPLGDTLCSVCKAVDKW